MDLWAGLRLADYIGAFLVAGGNAVCHLHDMPEPFGGDASRRLTAANTDVTDGAGHVLVTAYPMLRPDGQWSLLATTTIDARPDTLFTLPAGSINVLRRRVR